MNAAPLTPPELAAFLHRSTRTLEGWRYRGEGPPYVVACGRVLYMRPDVDAWLAAQRVTPGRSQ